MKKTTKNILAVGGIVSTVLGIVWAVPSYLQAQYNLAIASTFLIIGGLVILAIALGD